MSLRHSVARGLIDVVGRAEGLGRPLLYGTTGSFLEQFGLRHLEELPRVDELTIALRKPGQEDAVVETVVETGVETVVETVVPAGFEVGAMAATDDSAVAVATEDGESSEAPEIA